MYYKYKWIEFELNLEGRIRTTRDGKRYLNVLQNRIQNWRGQCNTIKFNKLLHNNYNINITSIVSNNINNNNKGNDCNSSSCNNKNIMPNIASNNIQLSKYYFVCNVPPPSLLVSVMKLLLLQQKYLCMQKYTCTHTSSKHTCKHAYVCSKYMHIFVLLFNVIK